MTCAMSDSYPFPLVTLCHAVSEPPPPLERDIFLNGSITTSDTFLYFNENCIIHHELILSELSPVHTDRVDARQLICIHRMSDVSLSYT